MERSVDQIYNKQQEELSHSITDKATISKWKDYRWQLRHLIRDLGTFERITGIDFSEEDRETYKKVLGTFPLSITPYYLSLIDFENYRDDPIFAQAFADPRELSLSRYDLRDPLAEDVDSPVSTITHRYPDRLLFLVSNMCSMYCRHCTRKRQVGDVDSIPSDEEIRSGIEYIRNTPQIRDVLLSGGDPLMLSDDRLDWILTELRRIPHVEILRIGTRVPAVLPYRITEDLVKMLKQHHPLWINMQFNHPKEITSSSREALRMLADAGLPLGNQSVLLAGVNDCPRIMKTLVHKLVQNRVRPYYLYQCDLAQGLDHFRTPVGKGMEIIESLIGHTTGFAVPTYVIDAPAGGGKIPIIPHYLISWSTNKVILRNYEGVITSYKEPDSYEPRFCDRNCDRCDLQLELGDADEIKSVGIEKLLSDADETIALIPEETDRIERRDETDS
jgi:lysine 2,3-aminomutase